MTNLTTTSGKTESSNKPTGVRSLRKNFSWTFAGQVVYAGCQWGMLAVLAKLGTPEKVGQFALGTAIGAPVILFLNLQLRSIQATDAKKQYHFGDYFGLRLATTALALLVIALIAYFSGYEPKTFWVVMAVGLAKGFEALSDVFYGLFQQHERLDFQAKSLIIKGPISLAAVAVAMLLTHNVFWASVFLAAAWGVLFLLYDVPNGARLLSADAVSPKLAFPLAVVLPKWSWVTLRQLVWLALPLGFVAMLNSLQTNIPRYFVENNLGKSDLGIFVAMYYLVTAGNTVTLALGQSAAPRLAKYYAAGQKRSYVKLVAQLQGIALALGSILIVATVIAGREILTLLYTPDYAVYSDSFVWVGVAALVFFGANFLGYTMTAARYFRAQVPQYFLVIAVTTLASLWLIPQYGIQGAVIVLVVSAVAQYLSSVPIALHSVRTADRPKEPATS